MYLKNYQQKVVTELKTFFSQAKKDRAEWLDAPEKYRGKINWVGETFENTRKFYQDQCKTGLGEHYPRIVIKVPTGGGKTLLAVEAIREYQNLFANKQSGLVVWIVPSETIYSQTIRGLRDKANPLRQLLDQSSGNRTLILEKGQKLKAADIEENLVILFIMIQSVSRRNGKEALKVFQDSGGFDDYFPDEQRLDLHEKLLQACPNLDVFMELRPLVKTSLGNAIRLSQPFIIIDEIHKVFSETARNTIDNLNPAFVLGLSATPSREMNILVSITGLELKNEEMIKLDMHLIPPGSKYENDWKFMLKEMIAHRERLERCAADYKKANNVYIRPIALIQVERTGKEQRGKGFVHSDDVKDFLLEFQIGPEQIAVKSSSQNDIEDADLLSRDCEIRYIITKEALREGWDCPFAYILGIIPNVNSNTGVTQLAGRILRQPFARKTGVRELDESYVYFSKGGTAKILESVNAGLKNEGLEDLMSGVHVDKTGGEDTQKTVAIRKEFAENFSPAFYLPVWVMIQNASKPTRRFSYSADIKSALDYSAFVVDSDFIHSLEASISSQINERAALRVGIDEQSRINVKNEMITTETINEISLDYMARRYAEIMENAFLAHSYAAGHFDLLHKHFDPKTLAENFGYITAYICSRLEDYKSKCEEAIFMQMLKNKTLVLAVSNDETIGFKIPSGDTITAGAHSAFYNYYLFDDVDITAMNSFEKNVGELLDKEEKIIWWFRNKAAKKWYSIQGWREHKIYPDFIAAKNDGSGKLELVYILESKGPHLMGAADTRYKQEVFEIMTKQKQSSAIRRYEQGSLDFGAVNDKVEYYVVEQGKEQEEIRRRFK